MNEKQAARWEESRKMGRMRFIITRGVVGWGIPVAVAWSTAMYWRQPFDKVWVGTLLALIVFPIGGYFFGAVLWRTSEKQYAEYQAKRCDP